MHVAQTDHLLRRLYSPSSCFVFSAAFIRLAQRCRWNPILCFCIQSLGRRLTIKKGAFFMNVKLLLLGRKMTLFLLFTWLLLVRSWWIIQIRTQWNQIETYSQGTLVSTTPHCFWWLKEMSNGQSSILGAGVFFFFLNYHYQFLVD